MGIYLKMVRERRIITEKDKIRTKEYYQKNKEKIKAQNKKWYEENKNRKFKGLLYAKNPNTKKAKMIKIKIDKINKEIRNLNLMLGFKNE